MAPNFSFCSVLLPSVYKNNSFFVVHVLFVLRYIYICYMYCLGGGFQFLFVNSVCVFEADHQSVLFLPVGASAFFTEYEGIEGGRDKRVFRRGNSQK